MEFHEKLQELRKQKGLTQEELAFTMGVSSQAVSKWESGQSCPDIALLPALADLFGITISDEDAAQLHTVGRIVDYLEKLQ